MKTEPNTMENMTKEQQNELWRKGVPAPKPPTWYSESQMYHWLIRENYSEQIAKELSAKWASDQQGAFNKGFEKGVRSVAAPKEEPKKKGEVTQFFLEDDETHMNEMVNRIFEAERKEKQHLKHLETELASLRDQLREKDEDFKWCIRQLQEFKDNGILWFNDSDWTKLDPLIKKSQKL